MRKRSFEVFEKKTEDTHLYIEFGKFLHEWIKVPLLYLYLKIVKKKLYLFKVKKNQKSFSNCATLFYKLFFITYFFCHVELRITKVNYPIYICHSCVTPYYEHMKFFFISVYMFKEKKRNL